MATATYDHSPSPVRIREGWRTGLWRALRSRACRIYSDETLVRRAQDGDHAAFDALASRYRKRLYTLAIDSLEDESEAAEALREMVLSAFRDIDSFGDKCSPGTWLYLHGFRAVFNRLNVPRGKYTFSSHSDSDRISPDAA